MTTRLEGQKPSRRRWIFTGIAGLALSCCLCSLAVAILQPSEGTPTPIAQSEVEVSIQDQQPADAAREPIATAIPSPTPSAITMAEISQNRANLTEIQWEEYEKTLPGLRVHWTAEVTQVSDGGTLYLEAGQEMFQRVYLEGVPKETALQISKGQMIEFEATIRSVETFLGLSVWLNNPTILSIR